MQEITSWELLYLACSEHRWNTNRNFPCTASNFLSCFSFFFLIYLFFPLHFHSLSFLCYVLFPTLHFHFGSSLYLVDFQVKVFYLKHKHLGPWSHPGLGMYLKCRQDLSELRISAFSWVIWACCWWGRGEPAAAEGQMVVLLCSRHIAGDTLQ